MGRPELKADLILKLPELGIRLKVNGIYGVNDFILGKIFDKICFPEFISNKIPDCEKYDD